MNHQQMIEAYSALRLRLKAVPEQIARCTGPLPDGYVVVIAKLCRAWDGVLVEALELDKISEELLVSALGALDTIDASIASWGRP